MGKIILGSSSPRRADILKKLKLDFEIIPSSYVEPHDQTDFSYDFVENLAYNKALYVAKEHRNDKRLVVGADTIVVIGNKILEKPKDFKEAKEKFMELLEHPVSRNKYYISNGWAPQYPSPLWDDATE